ncbi:mechanosensitive ion channel [Candidatus Woesearchaeota archaeon]|nr:mechanosensitive ion channel [Candidatus Woesearchaeota archaeon]
MPELFGTAQSYVYTLAVGIVILLVGFALGLLAKKFLHRLLKEIGLNKVMNKVNIPYDIESIVSHIAASLIYLITIVFFLNRLGITSIVLYLIVGAVLMLVILTFIVGLKDVIPNFVAWIILQHQGKVKDGYSVNVREIEGVVEKIRYLETEIKTPKGDILYVPNSLFLKSKVWVRK